MRQTSIPAAVVDALNEMFDAHPEAMERLANYRVAEKPQVEAAVAEATGLATGPLGRQVPADESVGLLDVINAVFGALTDGKQISVMHGPGGMEGFVLARQRAKRQPESVDARIAREQAIIDRIAEA